MKSRNAILNRISEAKKKSTVVDDHSDNISKKIEEEIESVTPKSRLDLWDQFKKELETISGEFYKVKNIEQASVLVLKFLSDSKFERIGISKEKICSDVAETINRKIPGVKIIHPDKFNYEERKKEFAITEVAIVHPLYAIADIGSLVFSYLRSGTSYPHFLCDNTFVIVHEDQILANQFEFFKNINIDEAKNMIFVTGPSRTADIEKVLVLGAHGPRKLVVLMIEKD